MYAYKREKYKKDIKGKKIKKWLIKKIKKGIDRWKIWWYEDDIIFIAVASKKMTTEIKNKKSVDKELKAW